MRDSVRRTSWLWLLFLLIPIGQRASAGGFTIIEMGAKKTGMMCSVAKPDDLSGVYHNPAGIADLRGTRFHLSTGLSFLDITAKARTWEAGEGYYGSDQIMPDEPVDGEFFADPIKAKVVAPMPMLVASTDFGLDQGPVMALSIYVPDAIGASLPKDAPTRYMVTDAYFVAGMASLTLAYRLPGVMDWLALGASMGVLYTRQEGKRWHNQPTIAGQSADYILHLKGEDYKIFWNAGLTASPIDALTIGLAWIGGTDVALKGSLEISLPPGVEEEDPLIAALGGLAGSYDQTTHLKVPAGLAAGLHWQVMAELDLAVDFRWWYYSVFKQQTMDHNIDLELLGQPAVDNPMVTPKDFNDSYTLSVGLMTRPFADLQQLELMAGWSYDWSPAPSRTKSLEMPTTDLTGYAMGARYTFDDPLAASLWRLALTYYRYWYLKDDVTDSVLIPPQNAKFWGTVDTVSFQIEVML